MTSRQSRGMGEAPLEEPLEDQREVRCSNASLVYQDSSEFPFVFRDKDVPVVLECEGHLSPEGFMIGFWEEGQPDLLIPAVFSKSFLQFIQ